MLSWIEKVNICENLIKHFNNFIKDEKLHLKEEEFKKIIKENYKQTDEFLSFLRKIYPLYKKNVNIDGCYPLLHAQLRMRSIIRF